jgi:hypothetical protein
LVHLACSMVWLRDLLGACEKLGTPPRAASASSIRRMLGEKVGWGGEAREQFGLLEQADDTLRRSPGNQACDLRTRAHEDVHGVESMRGCGVLLTLARSHSVSCGRDGAARSLCARLSRWCWLRGVSASSLRSA